MPSPVNVKCNLCGSENYSVLYNTQVADEDESPSSTYQITDHSIQENVRIVTCRRCGLIYANPRPTTKSLISNYINMVDEPYVAEEDGRRWSAKSILKVLKKHKKSGRLLDVGCATGFLLDEARKEGW